MIKEVTVGILAALGTAAILWFVGAIGKIPTIISVPTGAVVAFDLEECPAEGWKEFKAAHGRFVRGIDRSGNDIDPEGERNPASLQNDSIARHNHSYSRMTGVTNGHGASTHMGTSKPVYRTYSTAPEGAEETRPKNVALLYCQKT